MKRPANQKISILFLGSRHLARSRMAAALVNCLFAETCIALSAGVSPSLPHPAATQVMTEIGIAIDSVPPRSLVRSLRQMPKMDFVIDLSADAAELSLPASAVVGERLYWPTPVTIAASETWASAADKARSTRDYLIVRILDWAKSHGWKQSTRLPAAVRDHLSICITLPDEAPAPEQPTAEPPAAEVPAPAAATIVFTAAPVVKVDAPPVVDGLRVTEYVTAKANKLKDSNGSRDPGMRLQFLSVLRDKCKQIAISLPIGKFKRMGAATSKEMIAAETGSGKDVFVRGGDPGTCPEALLKAADDHATNRPPTV
jgi:protein-tyrosine-phosphatase